MQRAPWRAASRAARDVDEHAAHLSGWHQRYDQLGGGAFEGRLDEALGARVQLFRECTSRRLHQRCEVWPGALWIGLTEADDGSRLNGRRMPAAGVMASGTDGGFELVTPEGHAIVGLVVARDALQRHAPGLALPAGAEARCWRVDPALRRDVLARARAVLALAAAGAAAPPESAVLDLAVALLAAALPAPPERGNAAARRRLVAQVHERVLAAPECNPTVDELCAALHVSRRTLQYAFAEEAGVSPLAYVRSLRLNGVRRRLREPAPGQTVQAAAAAWGYWNLSAFAADYRRQFGERPSETLARA